MAACFIISFRKIYAISHGMKDTKIYNLREDCIKLSGEKVKTGEKCVEKK